MFTQIVFTRHSSQRDDWTPEYYVYTENQWATYVKQALTVSGYVVKTVRPDINPWEIHGLNTLWAQRSTSGLVVAMMPDEDTSDMVYAAADFQGGSRFGERTPVERPYEPVREEW